MTYHDVTSSMVQTSTQIPGFSTHVVSEPAQAAENLSKKKKEENKGTR